MKNFYIRNKPYIILLALTIFMALVLTAAPFFREIFIKFIDTTSYILWHNIFEFSGIIIAICIFCVTYYSFEQKQNFKYLLLGSVMFLVALVDFYHVMSFVGMPPFLIPNDSPNRATTFWIIARLIGGLGLLATIILPSQLKIRFKKIFFLILPTLISMVILIIATYYPHLIPPMYIDGQGLTKIKIFLEIIVIITYLIGITFLLLKYKNRVNSLLIPLACALLAGIFSELSFTLYKDVYGVYNFIGHFLKFLMYFVIFRIIFIQNIQLPYRDLSLAHAEIKNYADNLDKIVYQRTEQINLINKKLLDDLEYARDIQLSMLPKSMPNTPNVVFESQYFPADRVSGDFYNIIRLNETKIGIYIGDVAGHGVPAAMLTVFLNQSIKPMKENQQGFKEVLPPSVVLKNICLDYNQTNFSNEIYLAMLYGTFDLSTREFTFSAAGLNVPPMVISNSGEVKELSISGLPICRFPLATQIGYTDSTISLEKGDKILFYSDGLVEAINPSNEIYSESRLKDHLQKNAHFDAVQLTDSITQDIFHFIQGQDLRDDITFFIMEIK